LLASAHCNTSCNLTKLLWDAQALERNYWPSYNIPYFPEVYNRSGYPQFTAKLKARQAALQTQPSAGAQPQAQTFTDAINSMSYQLAPRAKISRRDQGSVHDLGSLKAYMRSNSWDKEPFSGGSAFGAICGRGDVDPTEPLPGGCNDAKVRVAPGQDVVYTCASTSRQSMLLYGVL
jgi:hypothetical protein